MRIPKALKLGLCLFLVVGLTTVRAEDDEDVEVFDVDEIVDDEDDYEMGPSGDIETACLFPDYPDNKLELGEIIKVAFLVNNKGDAAFNVTHVLASLRSPYDYSYHIQNFSIMPVGVLVPPGQQASFEYLFKPDVSLEPTEFWLTAEVLYNSSEDRMYKSAIFNNTVELVEKNADVDVKRFLKWVFVLALFGAGGYYFYAQNSPNKTGTSSTKAGASSTTYEDEVLELKGQIKDKDGGARNRKVKRKSGKNKKGSKKK